MKYIHFIIILILSTNVFAEEYLLEFSDGTVQYMDNNAWVDAYIGDRIPGNTDIKVFANTYAEFSSGDIRLILREQGTYSLDNLFKQSEEISSWSIGSLIGEKLERLVGINVEDLDAAAMGTRGAEIPGIYMDDDGWMDEHTELIENTRRLLGQGNYELALEDLLFEYSFSFGTDKEEISFYIGYIYSILDEKSQALKYLSRIENDFRRPYFSDFVLLKGSLLVESLLFDEAIELFDFYIDNYPDGEKTQYVYFLSAACYKGLGNTYQAKINLERAVAEDPSSDIGKASAEQIEELNM